MPFSWHSPQFCSSDWFGQSGSPSHHQLLWIQVRSGHWRSPWKHASIEKTIASIWIYNQVVLPKYNPVNISTEDINCLSSDLCDIPQRYKGVHFHVSPHTYTYVHKTNLNHAHTVFLGYVNRVGECSWVTNYVHVQFTSSVSSPQSSTPLHRRMGFRHRPLIQR